MRNLINPLLTVLIMSVFFACQTEDETDNFTDSESVEAVESEAAIEELTDEVDEIAFYAGFIPGDEQKVADNDKSPIHCATRTFDEENKTIIIDFGEGCEDYRGRDRSGKIIITYTDHFYIPGAVITITFEDFYVSGVKIEGTRTITNLSESLEDYLTFEVKFEGGVFTFPDGSVATREAHWIVKRIRTANPINDEKHIDGSAGGTTKNDVAYDVEILETIIFKRECGPLHVFLPVQGVKQITWGDHVKTVDYGDGECDRLVTITVDGVAKEVQVRRRFMNASDN